jgi:hypothetical protein
MRLLAVCIVLGLALMLAGCPGGGQPGAVKTGAAGPGKTQASAAKYPIPLTQRPYQKVHKSVEEAWFLVETGYAVIQQKYVYANQLISSGSEDEKQQGIKAKESLSPEIQTNVFFINPKINQLFLDAIAAEPDNPLNYAAYAYYLKARKLVDDQGHYLGEGEDEAVKNIDKAIKLWPDDSMFYLLKIHILSAPHQCHEWYRGAAGEEIVLEKRLDELRNIFQLAEQYDPDNAYINYYKALLFTQLTPPESFQSIRDEVYREVVAGNQKGSGHFFFPPPLNPYYELASAIVIKGDEKEAIYYDQWNFFGIIAASNVTQMTDQLLDQYQWPKDKESISELMLAVYQMGSIKPLSRSYFSLQSGIINKLQSQTDPKSQDYLDLANAARFLNQQYVDLANQMLREKVISDSRLIDSVGVGKAESIVFRNEPLVQKFQKREAAYLKKAGEILKIKFPLPENPEEW